MLVLTRKPNEAIQIGPEIRVIVTRIQGGKVRLGIEAPADYKIIRIDEPDAQPKQEQKVA